MAGPVYLVRTDLDPAGVTRVATEIFAMWLDFALGKGALNGKKIHYPSGKYAASIQFKQIGVSTIAIVADETVAPEALWLEIGHRAYDMKQTVGAIGRRVPLHRVPGGPVHANLTGGLRRLGAPYGSVKPGVRPSMWAEVRGGEFSGFASIGPNSAPDSWIIPAMPAYAPAHTLAAIAQRMAGFMEGRAG